jgi:PAS domain S-box-containing protein
MPYVSEKCYDLLGLRPEEIQADLSKLLILIPPEDSGAIQEAIVSSAVNKTDYHMDHHVQMPSGEDLWLRLMATPQSLPDGDILWNGVAINITERKQAEEKIQASLREKEALLREIHHRVKNNLQVVCALLDLQADTISDPMPREAFQESRNRVRSMAQIHEQLTQNENLAQVNMASYIEELVSSLRVAYGTEKVAIQIRVSDVTLPFDSVSPCGLLINELVSNAMKHAFPAEAFPGHNKIRIVLQKLPSNKQMLELIVADNGIGLPDDTDLSQPDSLGLTLVNLLVRQLNATLNIERDTGTAFRIVFAP